MYRLYTILRDFGQIIIDLSREILSINMDWLDVPAVEPWREDRRMAYVLTHKTKGWTEIFALPDGATGVRWTKDRKQAHEFEDHLDVVLLLDILSQVWSNVDYERVVRTK